MKDILDITDIKGKKQRLVSYIAKQCASVGLVDHLPSRLLMRQEQYEMLNRVPQMGNWRVQRHYPPEERLYLTKHNVMHVVILK